MQGERVLGLACGPVLAQRCGRNVQQLGLLVNAAGHVVEDVGEVREVSGVWYTKHHMVFVRLQAI